MSLPTQESWHIPDLIPQAGDMILIDRITAVDEGALSAEVVVRTGLFSAPDGSLPAWVGIELLAQAIAALAGIEAQRVGSAPRAGLLLGSRHYRSAVSGFASGMRLQLRVERSLQDEQGFGVFDGRISDGTDVLVEARLSVYQPDNIDAILGAAP
jgi:predicted hotdog family 3-hydroxylacyl-ACP dehydratase